MKNSVFILLAILLICGLIFGSCSSTSSTQAPSSTTAQPAAPIEISLLTYKPPNVLSSAYALQVVDNINKAMQGELFIKYKGSNDVIPTFDQGVAVKNGVIDMLYTFPGTYEDIVLGVDAITTLIWDDGRKTGIYDIMAQMHEKGGLFYFGTLHNGRTPMFYLFSNKKTETLKSLAGIKIMADSDNIDIVQNLGMDPINMADEELYTALQQNMVEAYTKPIYVASGSGWQEVTKYFIDVPWSYGTTGFIMNLGKWNSIPQSTKDKLMKIYIEQVAAIEPQFDKLVSDCLKVYLDAGVQPIKFSEADAAQFKQIVKKHYIDLELKQSPDMGPKLLELVDKYYKD